MWIFLQYAFLSRKAFMNICLSVQSTRSLLLIFFFAVKSNFLSYDGLSFYLVCCFFRVIQVKIKVCFPNALAPRIQSFCFLTVFEPGSSKSSVPLWNCHIPCFPQHLHFQFFSFFPPLSHAWIGLRHCLLLPSSE